MEVILHSSVLSFWTHIHKDGARDDTAKVCTCLYIIVITCDESQVCLLFMLHYTGIIRQYIGIRNNLIGIAVTRAVYKDILTYTQVLQPGKYARLSICTNGVCREYTIAFPRGISGSIQPSDLVLQPGDIPVPVLTLHTYNRCFHFYDRDVESKTRCVIGRIRACIHFRDPARSEARHRDEETVCGDRIPAISITLISDNQRIGGGLVIRCTLICSNCSGLNGVFVISGNGTGHSDHNCAG